MFQRFCVGLKAQRNARIKQVFLLNVGTEMKFYYNIQNVEEKAEQKVKIFFCGGGKILTMATEFLITRVGNFNFSTFYADVHFFLRQYGPQWKRETHLYLA